MCVWLSKNREYEQQSVGSSSQSSDKRSANSAAILRSMNFDRAIADQVFDRCGQGGSKQHALLKNRAVDCHGNDSLHRGDHSATQQLRMAAPAH